MNSITGLQRKSINEIKVVEELRQSVEQEMKGKGRKVMDRTANQLQALYLRYLSNVSPLSRAQNTYDGIYNDTSIGRSSVSTRVSEATARSPAFLLCEPKQLDFNSNERQFMTFIDKKLDSNDDKNGNFAEDLHQKSFEKNPQKNCEKRAELREMSTSPMIFPQSKSVQTDDIPSNNDNYADILNNLILELKSLLKIANQVNYESIKASNNEVLKNSTEKETQTSNQLKITKDSFTQNETNIELMDAFCQINVSLCHRSAQTLQVIEEKVSKVLIIDKWTQTDSMTDEDKSYDLSVGEVPYIDLSYG